MTQYRAYPIEEDGHLLPAEIIEAETDREAVLKAKALLNDKPIEVWEKTRLVARLEKLQTDLYSQAIPEWAGFDASSKHLD